MSDQDPRAAVPPPIPSDPTGDGVNLIIPYKNPCALIAYYLAVFSLIPCIGALLGLAAVILGIIGLVYAHNHEGARGRVHAWIGIVVGGFFFLLYTVGFAVLAALQASGQI